jgi:hypothetical protein
MQACMFRPNRGGERAPSGRNLGDEAVFIYARNPKGSPFCLAQPSV